MIVDVTIGANFRSALDARDPDKANMSAVAPADPPKSDDANRSDWIDHLLRILGLPCLQGVMPVSDAQPLRSRGRKSLRVIIMASIDCIGARVSTQSLRSRLFLPLVSGRSACYEVKICLL